MKGLNNQKGLTLIELLVSVMILSLGCSYALQALSKAAEAQQWVEARNEAYLFLASKAAEMEMRVLPETDPLKGSGGVLRDRAWRYQWNLSNMLSPLLIQAVPGAEQAAVTVTAAASFLVEQVLTVQWIQGQSPREVRLTTLSKVPVPEKGGL